MSAKKFNVLFLCTGNSARSIIAEALLNYLGDSKFFAYSAGSNPTGEVNPLAIDILRRMRVPINQPVSKHWDEFTKPDAPELDFVITVCDRAAGEPCPIWPGQPMNAHWGIADPAAEDGDEKAQLVAFRKAFLELENRLKIFVNLPIEKLDIISLQDKLNKIGDTTAIEISMGVDAIR